jgi:hypothetical protein
MSSGSPLDRPQSFRRASPRSAYLADGDGMAAHESPRITKLYDRTKDRLPWTKSTGLGYEAEK